MTSPQPTPEPRALVAIDRPKQFHEAPIEAPGWRRLKCLKLSNRYGEQRRFRVYLRLLMLPPSRRPATVIAAGHMCSYRPKSS